MTFASVLNGYCNAIDCTNNDLADASGISPSSLSRYRHGERTPETNGTTVRKLAEGIAALSRNGTSTPLETDDILAAFETELTATHMVGMDFNMRLDALMHLVGIRNSDLAEVAGVDPSYISRIRRGQRMPADIQSFSIPSAHLAARLAIDRTMVDDVGRLVDLPELASEFSPNEENLESEISEIIEVWLTGSQIVSADAAEMDKLFEWLDSTDFSKWLTFGDNPVEEDPEMQKPVARFYYGLGGMHSAERQFLDTALKAHARNLVLSSDIPLFQLDVESSAIDAYMQGLKGILRSGCHIDIIHALERPLKDSVQSLKLWTPLYMTGRVTPSYLRGVNNRLFCHVNRVCDVCALSGEAIMGHQENGRYYYTTRPEDIAYYQKKMKLILEKTSSLIEVFRECDSEQMELFQKAESARQAKGIGRRIGADRFENLHVTSYPGDCTVLSLPVGAQSVHFVARHPKINYIVARMK